MGREYTEYDLSGDDLPGIHDAKAFISFPHYKLKHVTQRGKHFFAIQFIDSQMKTCFFTIKIDHIPGIITWLDDLNNKINS
jgi:hypothetical protein